MSRRKSSSTNRPSCSLTRAEANRKFQALEARFQDFADLCLDWIWELDAEGCYTYCSDRVVDLLGYSAEDVLGKTLFDLMPPDEAESMRVIWNDLAGQKRPMVNLVTLRLHKDGRRVRLLTNVAPVLNEDGDLVGYRGVDRRYDQGLLLNERQPIYEQPAFLRQVLDINPNFVFVRDREGRFVLANRAIATAYGTTVEGLIGKTDSDFNADAEEVASIQQSDLEVMDSLREKFIPESLITYGGKQERWVQTIKRPLLDTTGVAQWVLGVSSDITERKQMEQTIRESLRRRERQVQTSTEVAQEIAAAPALDELFRRVVTLVKERFGYYHAQIFRYDPATATMQLVVGYGKVGEEMLAAHHHLPVGRGVVGTAAATGDPIRASNVLEDPDWVPNPFLPETKGELAVPIKLRDEILGILDVQSEVPGALTEEDQILLEGLCGQIAIAIESTQLLEALRENEIRYRALFEQANDAIFVENQDQEILDVNNRACELFGYTKQELLSMRTGDLQVGASNPLDIYTEPDAERELFDSQAMRKDGALIFIEISLSAIEVGDETLFYSVVRDITDRKQTEDALAQERYLLQTLMQNVTDHIYFKDLESRFIRINRAMADWLGLEDSSAAVGKSDFDFFADEHAQQAYEDEQRVVTSGEPLLGVEEKETWPDGHVTWVSSSKLPLLNEQGECIGTFGVSRDITANKRAEAELRATQQLLQGILDNTTAVIYVKDLQGRYMLINRSYEALFNVDRENVIGRTAHDLFPAELAEVYWQNDLDALEAGVPLEKTEVASHGGVEHTYLSLKFLIRDASDAPYAICSISTDITEREAAEAERRQLLADLTIIQEATSAMTAAVTFDEAVLALLPHVVNAVQAAQVSMFLISDDQMTRVGTYPVHEGSEDAPLVCYDLSDYPLTQKVVETRRPLAIKADDVRLQAHAREAFQAAEITANATIPLVGREGVLGTLSVNLSAPRQVFSEHDVSLLQTLADQTALTFENLRLFEAAQTRAQHQQALREISALVNAVEDFDGLIAALPEIVAPLRQLVPADVVSLATYRAEASEFTLFVASTSSDMDSFVPPGVRVPVQGSAPGWVIMHKQPLLEADIRQSDYDLADNDRVMAQGIASRLIVPLQMREHVLGTLNMASTQPETFTQQHVVLLRQLADQLAQTLERVRLLAAAQAAAAEAAATHRSYLRREWADYLQKEQVLRATYVYDQHAVSKEGTFQRPEMMQALKQGDLITTEDVEAAERSGLAVPIEVRGQILGVLGFEDPEGKWQSSPEQLALIQAVTQQLGQALENARLIEATQSLAERERLVAEVSSNIRQSLEMDTVLRTAVNELRETLQLAEVEVRIGESESE